MTAVTRAGPITDGAAEPEATCILPRDRELAFLAPLPVDLLDPDDRTAEALTRFGLHRIRDLLRLPRRDLAARLGPGLLELVARARGEEAEPPLPEPPEPVLEEGQDLEVPVDRLEPLVFVLRGVVSRLAERLALRGLGCVALRLTLQLESGARVARRVGVASPCQDERVLLRLLQLAIERDPPPAPVEGLRLCAEGRPLQREQLDLFLPRGPSPNALDRTLAELASLCGEARVGTPRIADDHRPDAFALGPFRPSRRPAPTKTRGTRPSRTVRRERLAGRPNGSKRGAMSPAPPMRPTRRGARLALRALRPPIPAEVRLSASRPVHLRSAISRGGIVRAAGPWRVTGRWWSDAARFAFDHYDVQMEDGALLRVRFDWAAKQWQVDGVYD